MYLLRKSNIKFFERIGILAVFFFLAGMFIKSVLISHPSRLKPDPDLVEKYARQFMSAQTQIEMGKYYDCSAYTQAVYSKFNIQLPRASYRQFKICQPIKKLDLKKGDLVFFSLSGKEITHVGIYLSNNVFIHSPGKNKKVRTDSLTHTYYTKHYYSGGRINFAPLND